jgi:glycosyltransferase involved in cell wall biosynthesis
MSRIALLSSEPLRAQMAGIGIRYLELARRLPPLGIDLVLLTAGDPEEVPEVPLEPADVRRFERGRLAELLADCRGAVGQGQLVNDLLIELPELPVAVDLYDPWLVENLHYQESLGLDPYRNDHATWVLQLSRGDFFLCSSQEQRLFYLGFLAALGRINPVRLADDPDLERLIAPVPFGVEAPAAEHRPYLPPVREGERRLLFGSLYDWYDPWTLLEALERLNRPEWTLLLIRNPNPESTPQRLLGEVEDWCRQRGWWGERVQVLDWVPAERRGDLLRDVDCMVVTHRAGLETRLALRTRVLDALASGCPVVLSEGGAASRLLAEHGAGWVVPPGDVAALVAALTEALDDAAARREAVAGARKLVEAFAWPRVLEPLLRFCRRPWRDSTKEEFAFRPATVAPPDRLVFRLRRWWRGLGS